MSVSVLVSVSMSVFLSLFVSMSMIRTLSVFVSVFFDPYEVASKREGVQSARNLRPYLFKRDQLSYTTFSRIHLAGRPLRVSTILRKLRLIHLTQGCSLKLR
jgi:hypothetical protein